MKVLLDTCAIIWSVSDPKRLSPGARRCLEARDTEVFVSVISCSEIACACDRGRLAINGHWKPWFRGIVDANGWSLVPIDLDIAEESYCLPGSFHADPADRIIVATARLLKLSVVTADARILAYPHVTSIWG